MHTCFFEQRGCQFRIQLIIFCEKNLYSIKADILYRIQLRYLFWVCKFHRNFYCKR